MMNPTTYNVPEGHDLSMHFEDQGYFLLIQGTATSFCAPLRRNVPYYFTRQGVPLSASTSCVVEVGTSNPSQPINASVRVTDSSFRELHAQIHPARIASLQSNGLHDGPVVMVTGEADTGKSSLCRSLMNLAVTESASASEKATANNKQSTFSISYIDVDVGQTSLACPGTISTAFVEQPISVDDPFTTLMPLSFFFGATTCGNDALLGRYLDTCAHTKQCLEAVRSGNVSLRCGGIIINTMGWVNSYGYEALVHLLDIFRVTHIIVTGSDAGLVSRMKTEAESRANRNISVLEYRANKRIFVRTPAIRKMARAQLTLKYFLGTDRTRLQPCRVVVQLGVGVMFLDAVHFTPMDAKAIPPLALCAVSHAKSIEEIPFANIAGFVVVLEVGKNCVTLLAPSPGPLPNGVLLVGQNIALTEKDVPPLQ